MALEELIGQEEVKKISGRPFGINPKRGYHRKEFVKRASDLFDVEDYYGKLSKNSGDMDALKDLVGLAVNYMAGDPQENQQQLFENPNLALEQGKTLLDAGYNSMAHFVENRRKGLLGKLSSEQLYSLFSRVPLYKTGDKEHDRVIKLREKVMQMSQASQEGGDISSIVQEEVRELIEHSPEEQRIYILRNQHLVIPSLTKAVIGSVQKAYVSLFRTQDGKLDKTALANYLEQNYDVAERFIDKVPDEEKDDYWDDNLKPQYVELARALYKSEKAEQKKEDNPGKEERKEEARRIGLRA